MSKIYYECPNETWHWPFGLNGPKLVSYDKGDGKTKYWLGDKRISKAEFMKLLDPPEMATR